MNANNDPDAIRKLSSVSGTSLIRNRKACTPSEASQVCGAMHSHFPPMIRATKGSAGSIVSLPTIGQDATGHALDTSSPTVIPLGSYEQQVPSHAYRMAKATPPDFVRFTRISAGPALSMSTGTQAPDPGL
eukprot:CAMPEP_0197722316 /NCGR_PEP_ID=MMETSP1434-20131217/5051_1 /TAXON_ID=265543 /ORGANISM="Minutocellus polymorphus, Strain CCMP3303" /LENGTH=130 /DNA_ID=CAMNT_0043307455 /DNA_START=130 /DNA_END=522 /DNA_ORIENTATION=+